MDKGKRGKGEGAPTPTGAGGLEKTHNKFIMKPRQ